MAHLQADLERVSRIAAVPTILEVVCRTTGMRFAAVARVTEDRWIACSVLDEINFGLRPGDELKVETTICHEIRQSREPVVINNVAEDDLWCEHATPAMYGFQSYISVPIILADGSFFGTLCAIDPRPARLKTPETLGMFRLFAELIAKHLDANRKLAAAESALVEERAVSELREEFIAVLGHDLRTPVRAVSCLADLLLRSPLTPDAAEMARLMRDSASRMAKLIDNLLDLARGRLGGGLSLRRDAKEPLEPVLREVMAELNASHPDRLVDAVFDLAEPIHCDRSRIGQLFSNLLSNALAYGSAEQPVRVAARSAAEHFELSVANAGEPIPPAALERLFQPFYRSAAQCDREGLGLGLYIAYEIAKAHGGTLEVRSTQEETRFTFRMPADQDS
ncbi:MAG TPA: GAF domain-containing sensor histidine kinase [Bryobacteraceae bacterium]|jgi:signal transduction histidine kinase|nr:GAF domain-containing sensor histidine kinase [Bryobacteraceae bacterium]